MHVRGARWLLPWVALMAALPGAAAASSEAGFIIHLGKFELQVFYSVALDYDDRADEAIRDPRQALFAMASLLQANRDAVAALDHTLRVDLLTKDDANRPVLMALEDPYEAPGRVTTVLHDAPLARGVVADALAVLCGRYPQACRNPAAKTLLLHRCPARDCSGQIRFGSFPSSSVHERFGLLPQRPRVAPPLRATRARMKAIFGVLDEE